MDAKDSTPPDTDRTPESIDALKQASEELRAKAAASARDVRAAAERDAARFAEIALANGGTTTHKARIRLRKQSVERPPRLADAPKPL